MNLLGYLITLANIQHFENSRGPLKDLSIKVAEVHNLYSELQAIPGLDISRFRETGYYRYKDVAKYLSKNLRNFIFNGSGDPKDEGVVLTLYFDDSDHGLVNNPDDTLSMFLHKDNIGNEVKEQVQDFLDNRYGSDYGLRRNKRASNYLASDPAN